MVGKWHLGARSPANLPINRGFQQHLGFLKGGEDHQTQRLGDADGWRGPDLWTAHRPAHGLNGTYSAFLYTHEAVRIVREHASSYGPSSPLFLYLAFQETHSPYEAPDVYANLSVPSERRTFNAMVSVMDEGVRNLTDALRETRMLDDTLLLFAADNGGVYHDGQKGNNFPLRGQKTSSFEGGVRVAAFLWGGDNVLPAQLRGTQNRAFFHFADFYATLLRRAGIRDPSDAATGVPPIDSIDQWKVILTLNATEKDSVRSELPLAYCPRTNGGGTRGVDNCCPTAEDGGWVPSPAAAQPSTWLNGALIRRVPGRGWYKLVWGEQHGFGVRAGPYSPNSSTVWPDDVGCPRGCLFEILTDETESVDLREAESDIFNQLVQRQGEIGLSVFQTNHSDVDDDADCLSIPDMDNLYRGFLGPRCGVARPFNVSAVQSKTDYTAPQL